MKIVNWKNNHWRPLLTLLLGIIAFCFWYFLYPHLLLGREETVLFLWNWSYFAERIIIPGGLAQYLGEFIVQFFINPFYGACWYAVLIMSVQLLTWRLIKYASQWSVFKSYCLSFLPAAFLWYVGCLPDVPLTPTIAILLTLAVMTLLPKQTKARWITAAVLMPVLYWLVGPAAVLLVLSPFIHKPTGAKGSCKTHWTYGIILLLIFTFSLLGSSWLTPYPLYQVARGIDYYWADKKMGTLEEMEYDMLMRRQDWNTIVKKYEKKQTESLAIQNTVKLALWNQKRLSQQDLEQGLILSNQTLKSVASAFLMSEVALHIGMVNISQRSAFEAMEAIPNYNKSARALRRLVETNLITGQDEVALKYITILEETLFYRSWAQKTKPYATHQMPLSGHTYYNRLKEVYDHGKDMFFY